MKKFCNSCKKSKNLNSFGADCTKTSGLTSNCKNCRSDAERIRRQDPKYKKQIQKYKSNPINKRRTKDLALKRIFGISIEEYDVLFNYQNELCAICKQKQDSKSLSVDHCHDTGRVRGLLCAACNQGIGHFKDDTQLLKRAIMYLNQASDELRARLSTHS